MIGRALSPGGIGLFLAGLIAAVLGLSATLAALRWPAWTPAPGIAATVRVLSPADAEGMARAQAAIAALPTVRAALAMSPERAAELLAAWSGAATQAEVTGLALIEVELSPGADPGRLEAALSQAGITAEVFAPPAKGQTDSAMIGAISVGAAAAGLIAFALLALARLDASAPALATLAYLGAAPGHVGAAAGWQGVRWGAMCAVMAAPLALGLMDLISPGAAWAREAQTGALAGAGGLVALAGGCAVLRARHLYATALRETAP